MTTYTTKIRKTNNNIKQKRIQYKEVGDISEAAGTRTPNILEYNNESQNEVPTGLTVKTVTANTSIQRIGMKIDRETVNVQQRERPIGKSLGRVVDYAVNDIVLKNTNNTLRSGKDIRNYNEYFHSLRPVITFSEKSINIFGEIDHTFDLNVYGQGSLFKIYDENFKLIPFRDFGKLTPKDLLGKTHVTSYPFVNDLKINFEQFVDPSLSTFDGAVDIFDIKNSLTNTSVADFIYKGANADLMGSSIDFSKKGTSIIDNHFIIEGGGTEHFLDSQESIFKGYTFPQIGVTGSSGKVFSIQGYSSDGKYIKSPFKDKDVWNENEYSFLTYSQKNVLLSSSNRDISEIGRRFKSSNNGFIFGESNKLGTDSISFGGLKK